MNDLLTGTGFNFIGTDVTSTASIDVQEEIDIKSLLYMVATIWGGEISYFQNDIELKQQLGQNRGADFRFGKNIQNIKRLIDRVKNTISYEVEIVQGTELQELGYFQLGDTIKVVDDLLGIEIDTRIIELEKDLVTGLNSSVILGQPINDLSNSFNNVFQTLNTTKKIAQDTSDKVNNVIDEHGNLIASKLSGALNTSITQVENSTSTVSFDDRGIITHNQPLESTSVKAILITSDGILIANAKNTNGTWKWRTAITADGISADEINTGTLTAININGVTITGSTLISETATQKATIAGGSIELYDKVNSKALLTTQDGHIEMLGYLQTGSGDGSAILDDEGLRFYDDVYSLSTGIRGGGQYLRLYADSQIRLDALMTSVGWLSAERLSVSGMKNCVVDTEKYGKIYFSAYETAEIYFGDIGESEVVNGECVITLDEKMLACVNTDIPYQVFLTPYENGHVWVEQRNKDNFVVKGDNIKFGWEVKAKRRKYENVRFGQNNI